MAPEQSPLKFLKNVQLVQDQALYSTADVKLAVEVAPCIFLKKSFARSVKDRGKCNRWHAIGAVFLYCETAALQLKRKEKREPRPSFLDLIC
jgi:hypothetical protein